MDNLELARKTLEEEDLAFVLVNNMKVIRKSEAKGIKTLATIYKEDKELLEGAYVADKVIGKAAALFLKGGNIIELYAELISEEAIEILKGENIKIIYSEKTEKILNRDMTDICPMEKLSEGVKDPDILLEKVEEFFKKGRK